MGEAKRRGTFEQRREQSIRRAFEAKRKDIIYESEEEKQIAELRLQAEIQGPKEFHVYEAEDLQNLLGETIPEE